jgi:class 3 adenylate cyclase/tetratricopeptide (TPR) repeat protein
MTFEEILDQALAMLQRRGRLTYGALKRQFQLDDAALDDLKEQLLYAYPQVVDDAGRGLVWTGETAVSQTTTPPTPQPAPPGSPRAPQAVHPPPTATPPATPPPHEAERRQLTVLFCDLVESTRLSGQLDPEDLRAVVRAYQSACAEVVQRFDGHIAQYLGDGLLVYFGYPQAHEDDAQRAVRAGLGMVAALQTLSAHLEQRHGVRVAVRLGIHTGLVVVGEIGSGSRQENLALGETPNLAARLQGLAAPDTVVISAATFRLVQGYFTAEQLGAHTLRGMAAPMHVYRILGESGIQSRLDAVTPTHLTPLVGREEEVALLHRRWEVVKAGMGQVVLLSGEAGIGKSRLVQVLKAHVTHEPHTRIEWRWSPYHQESALYPVIDHLHRLLRWHQDDSSAEKLHALEAALASSGLALTEAVPLLAALLSLPLPASYPPLALTPQQQRQKTLEILLAWLHTEARRQPVLVIVEDLHWIDPSTLELLSLLIEQSAQARLCLVLTARPEFHSPWTMIAHMTSLTLRRLAPAQVERVARHVAGDKALPRAVLHEVVRKTDGVPLFVEELTKTVLESGLLQEREDYYELSGTLPPLAIPATLHDALMARLDRLAAVKVVAQLGAVIGHTFTYELMQTVAQLDATVLQGALAQLVESEVVAQRGLPPQATYTFKHALVQDAAYQSLLRSTRQQYHQQIAHVLEAQFADICETQPELLAHHYTEAGLSAQAIPYWQRAGQRAMARSGYREAVACFEQVLVALRGLPERRDTLEQAIDLRLTMRNALLALGDYKAMFDCLREAETLAEAIDDHRRLGRISAYMTEYFRQVGDSDRAVASGQHAIALAESVSDVGTQVVANAILGNVYDARGDYRQAIEVLQKVVKALTGDLTREHFGMTGFPFILSCSWLARCLAEVGAFREALAHAEAGLRIAETVNDPFSLVNAYSAIGRVYLRQGVLSQAIPLLARDLALCQSWNIGSWLDAAAADLGHAYALSGRVAEALPLLEEAASMGRSGQAMWTDHLSEAYLLAGQIAKASTLAEHALALARERKQRGFQAWALRLLAEIASQSDPPEIASAEAHYQQALALAEELGMRPLQAHCLRSLGMLYTQMGQREQARAELSTAIEMYRAMDMTFWLPQAEAALAQVEGR